MRTRRILAAVLGSAMALSFAGATMAVGQQVTLCHATDSETNPYVEITVDISGAGLPEGDHSNHTGPIWYPGAKDARVVWGDIIPAYDFGTFHYPGLNVPAGQAFLDNHCNIPPPPTPSPSPTPTLPPTSTSPASPALPSGTSMNLVLGLLLLIAGGITAYAMRPRRSTR